MHDWESLSHVRWEYKYHVVIIPKYRRKVFYGKLRRVFERTFGIRRNWSRARASLIWTDVVIGPNGAFPTC